MLQPHQIELIHKALDGAATPDESAAVRKLVAEDPEARAYDADLRRMAELFERAGDREAPVHLKHNILAALARSARASPAPRPPVPLRVERRSNALTRATTSLALNGLVM